jgi:TldD protein
VKRVIVFLLSLVLISLPTFLLTQKLSAQQSAQNIVLKTLEEELARIKAILIKRADTPPYFISYQVTELQSSVISASYGALRLNNTERKRYLDVEVRVGDYQLDNTHQIRSEGGASSSYYSGSEEIPVEDDIDAIKSIIWLKTDERYKDAVERLMHVKTNQAIKIKEESQAADFSRETPQVKSLPLVSLSSLDRSGWERKIKEYSAIFNKYPEIYGSAVLLTEEATNKYFVNSEGTSLQHGRKQMRINIMATTKADDGMDLFRYEYFDALNPEELPSDAVVKGAVDKLIKDLLALRRAPVVEPYTGPAILSGRASGVFFHEIFGHRIEGHRQKSEEEGNTFTKQVGQSVLPSFISVYDDPTLDRLGNTYLSGTYQFDDEGVKAQRVSVVENGVMRNFLMSRSPIENFEKSNGHGRKFPGFVAVGRQGNLVVQASKSVSNERLREMLKAECRRQGKKFGLFFEDISGGFTITARSSPQAYQVMPIMVYRIYTDNRPDELVRGVDLIGTPLTSFSKIMACGDKPEVFNGICGAESGPVPVSAISPSILTTQIEIQKRQKSSELLPILPPPSLTEINR